MNRFFGNRKSHLLFCTIAMLLLASCNTLKYVPDDKKLYTGANIDLDKNGSLKGAGELKSDIKDAIGPVPNSKFFGMRLGLWAHYKMAQGDSGFVVKFVDERFGEEPVYLEDLNRQAMEEIILNRCENNGFFYSRVASSVDEKEKTASANYLVSISQPYLLENYSITEDSVEANLASLIGESMEETELKPGTRFDTDDLRQERQRIDEWMKNRGYYEFNSDYLIFTTDTNQHDTRLFDLYLSLKKATPGIAKKPYSIADIYIYPQYSVSGSKRPVDTVGVNGYQFIQDSTVFKPHLMMDYLTIEPGQYYHRDNSQRTTRRFSNIQYYEFANIRYQRIDTGASRSTGRLKASVLLTPGRKQDIRLELQGITKSTNFAGPQLTGTYSNKNLWKGGEVMDLSASVSYEMQMAGGSWEGLNAFQLRLQNSLTFPRFISPFNLSFSGGYAVPSTRMSITYNLQDRGQYYLLNSLEFRYGYIFQSNRFLRYEVNPVSLNYMQVSQQTSEFEDILESNPFLARSFRSQFIPAGVYNLIYNELGLTDHQNEFYIKLGLDASGFVISRFHRLMGMDQSIMGLPYAQYVRPDLDIRHYWKTTENSTLATRIFAGAGFPYGNSASLPYIKQYFSGGPNSIRAFRIRSIGPGTYNPPDTSQFSFFDQAGDIRLEFNTEYRFPILSPVNGAFFVDAGNVWLQNENPALPGGKFESDFVQELAVGVGFGIRVDISVLVIRLDLGHPLRYPHDEHGSHWVNDAMLRDVVWNFAIGYPF